MTKLWIISLVAAATAIGLYLSNGSSNSSVKQIPMEIRQHFEQWTTQHARVYNTPEERNFRLNVFSKNYIFVTDYNTNHPGAAELGLTQFADLTPEEFVASSGAKQEQQLLDRFDSPSEQVANNARESYTKQPILRDTVDMVDWESKGVLPPIGKIDSSCRNAGWAFAVRDAVTANHAIVNGQMPSLISAQKLLDCTKFTCENPQVSSDTNRAIEKVNLTLDSEYKGSKTGKKSECINSVESALTVDQRPFVEFGMGSGCFDATAENQIQDGVVVAMLKIDPKIVQFYKGDVITHDQCYTEDAVIYNVAVTGYNRVGVKGSQPFWQVRMAFGDTWGIKGTMRIQKTNDSKTYIMVDCGLRRDFYFPEMKKY